jgi:CheY-like chemotaxis protein
MKKVLLAHNIHVLLEENYTFLNRTDIELFVATTTDKALKTHLKEHVDLIIAELDMPGMPSDEFCSLIRKDAHLRKVSILMVCGNDPAATAAAQQCGANAVLTRPVHPIVLMEKAQQLLEIPARGSLRAVLSVTVDGRSGSGVFSCRTCDISTAGMLIETVTPLEPGALLSCHFWLSDEHQVQASCRVVRSVPPAPGGEARRYGLMFTDIGPEARKMIDDYVATITHRSRPAGS